MGEVSPKIDNDWHDEYDVFISYRRQGGGGIGNGKAADAGGRLAIQLREIMIPYSTFKRRVYETIQPDVSNSVVAKVFDVIIMALIIVSVAIVFAVTFELPHDVLEKCRIAELVIVAIFVVEYLLRLWTANLLYPDSGWLMSRVKYVFSAVAIVDLLAIMPSFLPLILPEGLLGIRALRLMRLLRVFKAAQHSATLSAIADVIKAKAKDLLAVLFFMSLMVLFLSLLMYAAEHDAQPDKFENAISALWWSVETFTKSGTRGFYPITTLGRIIGVVVSVLGICLIAIPTGIISSGLIEQLKNRAGQNAKAEDSRNAV